MRKNHPGIYVASRVSRAPMWRGLRDNGGVPITSTWIDEDGEGQTADFGELWTRCAREIAASTGLVFYADVNDAPWKGALVEVGIALALGKSVGVVQLGEFEGRTMRPVGSWIHHPAVKVTRYISEAIDHAQGGTPRPEGLESQVAELRAKLAAYEEPVRRRARLEQLVAFLFPRYDARKPERPLRHPAKKYWWNGADIDENHVSLGDAGSGARCRVESYVGGGETDWYDLDIPAEWMDAEDFRPLATKWIEAEFERLKREEAAAEKASAEADLKDAQRRLAAAETPRSPPLHKEKP